MASTRWLSPRRAEARVTATTRVTAAEGLQSAEASPCGSNRAGYVPPSPAFHLHLLHVRCQAPVPSRVQSADPASNLHANLTARPSPAARLVLGRDH